MINDYREGSSDHLGKVDFRGERAAPAVNDDDKCIRITVILHLKWAAPIMRLRVNQITDHLSSIGNKPEIYDVCCYITDIFCQGIW